MLLSHKLKPSDQIFRSLQENNHKDLYLSYPDEGHGRFTKVNNTVCLAYSEWLLAKSLGGEFEGLSQKDLDESSAVIQTNGLLPDEVLTKATE